ncbi:hypothetical protein CLV28_3020 [Sediminihabitans luteus]|uniref:Uncharacterized protein n=1 Tax=Sediminihabitans luteus TaxID=1138585 RepID=A0A2M9CC02_9CELL|nr:hypothetical protein CLV28_3020 [Sediminihabitans luteus]GII99942.1 hypothetical protein Slu03_23200 [Sediminihabitans luteus]
MTGATGTTGAPAFAMLGAQAPVCVDGVCALPDPVATDSIAADAPEHDASNRDASNRDASAREASAHDDQDDRPER